MEFKKHRCSVCQKDSPRGMYNFQNKFVCSDCFLYAQNLHLDMYEVDENGKIQSVGLYDKHDEKNQRALFIDYVYKLFGSKISTAAFKLMDKYVADGMTYIGMTRAMEWFYVVNKNPISKAKKNIAIIPYVYDKAQAFYAMENIKAYNQFRRSLEYVAKEEAQTATIITKADQKKTNQLDMSNL